MTQMTQEGPDADLTRHSKDGDVSGHLMKLPATNDLAKKLAEAIEAATKTCPPVRQLR